jgi:predicted ferric reductase
VNLAVRGALWVALYFCVAVAPLMFALIDLDPGRGFLVNLSVALGFVGLSMMGLQFLGAARLRVITRPYGIDLVLRFHRQIAYVAVAFILLHPLLLIVEDWHFADLFDPLTSPLRAKFAVIATLALIALVILSVARRRMHVSYETWQATHAILAIIAVVAALGHVLLVGYYIDEPWEKALWVAMTGAFLFLIAWVRMIRPLLRRHRAWIVREARPERGGAHSLVLEPSPHYRRHGADRFRFAPGEFGWLSVGRSPFAITQHPFSFSSSAEQNDSVTMTIRAIGDFTQEVGSVEPGAVVYLDGPYGAFSPDRHEGPGFVFVGGGVGVTPLMSMMRTMAEREDPRPIYLFLGNRRWEEITFREDIDDLAGRLNLEIVHVLSSPHEGWKGERGRIDAALLDRHLPERRDRLECFVCGSEPMMDAVEAALLEVGIAPERIHAERFGMV